MKKLLLLSVLLLTFNMSAQTYKVVGNELVQVIDTTKTKTKSSAVKTKMTVTKSGVKYPVYKLTRGKYFIKRVSKKTGNAYNQYLKLEE